MTSGPPTPHAIRPLTPETWPAFAALVEANGGIFGGCWCIGFHAEGRQYGGFETRRDVKKAMVDAGTTRHALVFDGGACLGWAQFGTPAELPAIKNRKAYTETLDELPDWRITCLFVGKGHRKQGVADAAVTGALDAIAALGGGTVEGYPEDVAGRKVSGTFLWNGTLAMFERLGFAPVRKIGKHKWVVRRTLPSAAP
jgi:ribosomal protein S18 acetylase RimI-like enzyme